MRSTLLVHRKKKIRKLRKKGANRPATILARAGPIDYSTLLDTWNYNLNALEALSRHQKGYLLLINCTVAEQLLTGLKATVKLNGL